ncbi:hypothetical protein SAMN04487944_10876 [Gracilibacillus ureilyticus]|uniref:Uncharacterized protein n=1 Tax=Gracilibacillus ureilyticus TaxID=531814 RepID=A0A1H9R964_9BACI|nr:hypothetical protein [Gracilibacillus ureilyticus]SER69266.1 hypothetical protein SAMN04487944_10876 [Gracilibacillus ureilyticus]
MLTALVIIGILIFGLVAFFSKDYDLEGLREQLTAVTDQYQERQEQLTGLAYAQAAVIGKGEELHDILKQTKQEQAQLLDIKEKFIEKSHAIMGMKLAEEQALSILNTYNQTELDEMNNLDLFGGYLDDSDNLVITEQEENFDELPYMEDEHDWQLQEDDDLIQEEERILEEHEWEEQQRLMEEQQRQIEEQQQLEEQLQTEEQLQMEEDMNNNHGDMIRAEMEDGEANGMGFHPFDEEPDDMDNGMDDMDSMDDYGYDDFGHDNSNNY